MLFSQLGPGKDSRGIGKTSIFCPPLKGRGIKGVQIVVCFKTTQKVKFHKDFSPPLFKLKGALNSPGDTQATVIAWLCQSLELTAKLVTLASGHEVRIHREDP